MHMNSTSEKQTAASRSFSVKAPETILVVDDSPALCQVASMFLQHCGYRVLTATHGEQAKEIAQDNLQIDLVLTDLEMPVMLGDELAEWFRVMRPGTAVVFMSGDSTERQRLNPCFFVEKPFVHLDILLNTIREALNHRRAISLNACIAA